MRRKLPSPLSARDGVDPVRLRLPASGPWSTVRDHLVQRLPRVEPARIDEMLREGEVVGSRGPVGPDAPFMPDAFLWFHRDLPTEVPVPFGMPVVFATRISSWCTSRTFSPRSRAGATCAKPR